MRIRKAMLARGAALATVASLMALTPTAAQAATAACTATAMGQTVNTVTTSNFTTNAPAKMYVGDPAANINVVSNSTIKYDDIKLAVSFLGAKRVGGKSSPTVLRNGGDGAPVNLTFPPVAIVANQDINVAAAGVMTYTPPSVPGPVKLSTAPDYTATTEFYDSMTSSSPNNVVVASCSLSPATQDTTFATIQIVARSTTALTLAQPSVQYGNTVAAQAQVSVTGGTPSGQVVFAVDGTDQTPVNVASNGRANFTLPGTLAVGDHAITARFVPTNSVNFEASTSAASTLTVTPPAVTTTTSLALARTNVPAETSVQGTATVTPASAVGNVQFLVGNSVVDTQPLSNGKATGTIPGQYTDTYKVRARFMPTDPTQFATSLSADVDLVVSEPAVATTTNFNSLTPTSVAQGATVRAGAAVSPAAAGRIDFKVGSEVLGSATVSGSGSVSNVQLSTSALTPGSHQVVAEFVPSGTTHAGSVSAARPLTVTAPATPTTTSLSLSTNSAGAAADVTATANVTPADVPGQVEFTVGTAKVTAAVSGGTAQAVLPKVGAGTHTVTARFIPSGTEHAASTSSPATLELTAETTTTTLQLSRTTAVSGESVGVTATVAPAAATGTVEFSVGSEKVTATLTNGTATANLPALPVGEHQVVATYKPSGQIYAQSASAAGTLTMEAPTVATPTQTVLGLSQTTVAQGSTVHVTATVSADGGAQAIGAVTFVAGSKQVSAPVVAGVAQADLPALAVGEYQVTARFVPEQAAVFAPSTSAGVTLTVLKAAAATYTAVQVSPSEAITGQTILATATVSSSNGAPVGEIRFTVGSTTVTRTLNDRQATWTLPVQAVGEHAITAEYVPSDALVHKASSGEGSFTVSAPTSARTVTGLSLAADRITAGSTVRATATVSATSGGAPTGQVVFEVGGEALPAVTVGANGKAQADLPDTLMVGVHEVVARFVPTGSFLASTSPMRSLVVADASNGATATQTLLGFVSGNLVVGQDPVATVEVAAVSGTPEGTVRLRTQLSDGSPLNKVVPLVDGAATVTLDWDLPAGAFEVTATYSPTNSAAFAASAAVPRTVTVAAPAAVSTVTSLELAPASIEEGETATATATVRTSSGTLDGAVEFTVDGQTHPVALVAGQASLELADLAAGQHTIGANFVPSGTSHSGSSTDAVLEVLAPVVKQAAATTSTLTLSAGNVVAGTQATATVAVTSSAGQVNGDVEVKAGSFTATAPLVGGKAVVSLPALPVGLHPVSAKFVGNDDFAASTAESRSLGVSAPAPVATAVKTTTALTIGSADLHLGESIPVSASVAGGASGQVRFSAGWTAITVPVTNGTASGSLPALASGPAAISATFIPADTTKASASWDTQQVTVGKARSSVTVKGKFTKKTRTVTVNATITTTAPSGTCDSKAKISILVGKKTVRSLKVPVSCAGVAKRPVDKLPVSKAYTVVVTYLGSSQVESSKGSSVVKAR